MVAMLEGHVLIIVFAPLCGFFVSLVTCFTLSNDFGLQIANHLDYFGNW